MLDDNSLLEFLNEQEIEFDRYVKLKKITYFKSGGIINFYITPTSVDRLSKVIFFLNKKKLKFKVLGASTNCIFLDETNIDIIISLKNVKHIEFNMNNMEVYVEAGAMLPKLVRKLKDNSIVGFEGIEGIPATLGGAILMNAGSYGYEISDYLVEVTFLDDDGSVSRISKKNCLFTYRGSIFKNTYKNKIIVGARFKLKLGDKNKIDKEISFYNKHRHKILEYQYPNVGSVFVTHDIYRELAKKSFTYKVILIFTRIFIHRVIRAKSNFLLNKITFRFFGIDGYLDVISEKTMNVVVNRQIGTNKIIDYIDKVHNLIGKNISKEIEII